MPEEKSNAGELLASIVTIIATVVVSFGVLVAILYLGGWFVHICAEIVQSGWESK